MAGIGGKAVLIVILIVAAAAGLYISEMPLSGGFANATKDATALSQRLLDLEAEVAILKAKAHAMGENSSALHLEMSSMKRAVKKATATRPYRVKCVCAPDVLQRSGDGGCSLLTDGAVIAHVDEGHGRHHFYVEFPPDTKEEELSIAKNCQIRIHTEGGDRAPIDIVKTDNPRKPFPIYKSADGDDGSAASADSGATHNNNLTVIWSRWWPTNLYHMLIAPTSMFKAWTVRNAALKAIRKQGWIESSDPDPVTELFCPFSYMFNEQNRWEYRPYYELAFGDGIKETIDNSYVSNSRFNILGLWGEFEPLHFTSNQDGSLKGPGQGEFGYLMRKWRHHMVQAAIKKYGDAPLAPEENSTTSSWSSIENETETAPKPIMYHHRNWQPVNERFRGIREELGQELRYRLARRFNKTLRRSATSDIARLVVTDRSTYGSDLAAQFHSIRSRRFVLAGEGAFLVMMIFARPETVFVQVWHNRNGGISGHSAFFTSIALLIRQPLITYQTDGDMCFPSLEVFEQKLAPIVALAANRSETMRRLEDEGEDRLVSDNFVIRVFPNGDKCTNDFSDAAGPDPAVRITVGSVESNSSPASTSKLAIPKPAGGN